MSGVVEEPARSRPRRIVSDGSVAGKAGASVGEEDVAEENEGKQATSACRRPDENGLVVAPVDEPLGEEGKEANTE
jgi:hypothetical protein